ncbi:ATP-binding cassette domain-containing protein [Streptomyces sp. NPDC001276]|uniref:ATP-binding cassette domain-containing protein n=1 Tax=Streptomyces sp. NPDC001276 TaxID=3364555 RepID=UPI0036BD7BBB
MDAVAIEADTLVRTYGQVKALNGLTLRAAPGTVLGLLGPNGWGKTTAVSILSTAVLPDSGRASVRGLDVVRRAPAVREVIGVAGQFAAVEPQLTGRENLVLLGRLSRL